MMAADVQVRVVRSNSPGDGNVVALNGTPVNGSRWDPPGGPYDHMKEPGIVWEPPAPVSELVDSPVLPPRAGIALLKMQLRAALNQESTEQSEDSAREQLRSRLDLLVAQRRAALDIELEQARAEAATTIEEARRAAALIVDQAAAAASVVTVPDDLVKPQVAPIDEEAAAPAVATYSPPESVALLVTPAPNEPGQLARVQPTGNMVIDAQSFAVVVATVVATLLDERFKGLGPGPVVTAAPAPPPKQSFWSHARHPDVILLVLTTAIVLVILAAWLA